MMKRTAEIRTPNIQNQTQTENPSKERTYRDEYNDEQKASIQAPSKWNINLTSSNIKTIEKLKNNESVPQADITRMVNNLIKANDKETFKDISDEVFKKEKAKHPNTSDDKIVKDFVKRFKGVESKNFIRSAYQEVIIPSGGEKIKTKKDAEKNPTVLPKKLRGRDEFEEMIKASKTTIDSGKDVVPKTGGNVSKGVEETKLMPKTGMGTKPSGTKPSGTGGKGVLNTVSDFFDTTSNLYSKNKGLIDGIANSMTPENMESGAWFTDLASLSQPEVKVIAELMKFTPLGATAKDYVALEKIKRGEPSGLSDSEEQMLAFKSIVNPDLIGKSWERGISKVSGDIGDAVSSTWGKITGHPLAEKKTELQIESAEAIAKRLATAKKSDDKKKYVESLMADPDAKVYPDMPTGFGKTGGSSGAFNPKTGQSIYKPVPAGVSAEQALTPPDMGTYGWTDPTVMEDISRWLVNAVSPVKQPSNKEEYIALIKQSNPELYARYEKELGDYNWKLKKTTLTPDTQIDTSFDQNKKLIKSIQVTNDALIKRARSLKQLTTEQAEEAYDINESLTAIMDGKAYMTYDDIKKINTRLIEQYSPEVVKLAFPQLDAQYKMMDDLTESKFKGDVGLKLTPEINSVTGKVVSTSSPEIDRDPAKTEPVGEEEKKDKEKEKEEEEEEEEKEEKKKEDIKKEGIKEERVEVGQNDKFPRIRPQLVWGGTNDTLIRKDDEYKNSQIYNEMMSINPKGWFKGETNKLYLSTVDQDEMRYNNTYQLPYRRTEFQPDPRQFNTRQSSANLRQKQSYKTESQNDIFNELQRPVMISQYAPMNGFDQAYNPNEFAQYQKYIIPKEFQVTYPMIQQQIYTNSFPYVVDQETGGEPQKARVNKNDYIVQQRFSKK